MATFTKAQLEGGARYSRGVLIGNWSEDASAEEALACDFSLKRDRGELMLKRQQRMRAIALQEVPHSFHEDGLVRIGDALQLSVRGEDEGGEETEHLLANNLWEVQNARKEGMQVTACATQSAVARNVFVVGRRAGGGGGGGEEGGGVLKYGERFTLASNPSLRVDAVTKLVGLPYFLASERPNNVLGAGAGSTQEVCMVPVCDSSAEWVVVPQSGARFEKAGLPVRAGDAVQLVHASTNQPLAAQLGDAVATDFGPELQVHAFAHRPAGIISSDRARPALPPNLWRFRLASDAAAAVDERDLRPVTAEALMERVRAALAARGTFGIRAIGRLFRIMDDKGDGRLDREDLKWGLFDVGVRLSEEEFRIVLDAFDESGDGLVQYDEFLTAVRPPLSEERLKWIERAFAKLDHDGSGEISLAEIAATFDPSALPEVQSGDQTPEEAVRVFAEQWDADKDGTVTKEEWVQYFQDVSASIDEDSYFAHVIQTAWGLGEEGE